MLDDECNIASLKRTLKRFHRTPTEDFTVATPKQKESRKSSFRAVVIAVILTLLLFQS